LASKQTGTSLLACLLVSKSGPKTPDGSMIHQPANMVLAPAALF
jgi:hypothetical protein